MKRLVISLLLVASSVLGAGALTLASVPSPAHAATSVNVAYVFDDSLGSGVQDSSFPGSSIFTNAVTGSPIANGGTYNGATFTDVPVSVIDANPSTALTGFDTVILYEVCDIGSHPNLISAVNTFLLNGGKVMIFDADRCASGVGGVANYSTFVFPFSTSSPGPQGASGSYTFLESNTLTTGLALGPQTGDSVGDANIFTTFNGSWCKSIAATNTLGANGIVEGYAITPAAGLALYEGEDFWFTDGATAHLKLVFDNMLAQTFNPVVGLPCGAVASGITLTPPTATNPSGTSHTVTATVTDTSGNPSVGVTVTFNVTAGPNAGKSGTGVTGTTGKATFTYTDTGGVGTDTIAASFTDALGNVHNSNTVTKIWFDQSISAKGVAVSPTEGTNFCGTVATFTDPDLSAKASDYSASIAWGDGNTSTGTISQNLDGSFSVSGCNVYSEEGTYTITTTITDTDNATNGATVTSTATVGDAALTATCASPPNSVQAFSGPTATFTDASSTGTLSDFSATIAWGDSSTSAGTITGGPGIAPYTVSGSHTYTTTGYFTITTTINDVGGSTATTSCQILVFAFAPGGGSFVIGDKNAAVGTNVTFWGAHWWTLNSLSGGPAPASFKGFAEFPKTPACGIGWSTDPGNSTPPPPGPLPAYMAVIVTSKATQSGSAISGNTLHLVIVKTNPGYAPDPGHAGTGTVVQVIC
jgi:Bacterial Ig-like domain (group 1)